MLMRTTSRPPNAANKKAAKRPVWALSKNKRRALIDVLAKTMRVAEPTAFAEEAPRRHGLRSNLCLAGWPWIIADLTAAALVHTALRQIGARRPYWIEGQRDYCHGVFLRNDHCWICGSPLPPYAKKFCGPSCQRIGDRERWKHNHDE